MQLEGTRHGYESDTDSHDRYRCPHASDPHGSFFERALTMRDSRVQQLHMHQVSPEFCATVDSDLRPRPIL